MLFEKDNFTAVTNSMKLVWLSALILLSVRGYSASDLNIIPKQGFKDLYIGMTSEDLIVEIGNPSAIVSHEEEKQMWLKNDYDLESKIIFHIGFDRVYRYDQSNTYGLWKAYVKDEKVVYLSITSYNITSSEKGQVIIDDQLSFGDSMERVFLKMGQQYYRKIDEQNFTEIVYFSKGLRFIFVNDELHHVYVFKPLPKGNEKILIDHFKRANE